MSWLEGILFAAGILLRIELTVVIWPAAFMAMYCEHSMSLEVAASSGRPDAASSATPTKTLFISRSLQSFYRPIESARAFRSANFDVQDTSAIPGKYIGPYTNKILMSFLGRFWDCVARNKPHQPPGLN